VKTAIILALLGLATNPAWAERVGENCPYAQSISDNTVANRFFTVSAGCLLQITPLEKPNLLYREYVFDERGRFLVFNSVPGPYETSTSRRNFFLFPRRQVPSYRLEADGSVTATLSTGQEISFLAHSTRIASFPGVRFTENTEVSLDAGGGVELESFPGILLDTGWKIGASAYLDPAGSSYFQDSAGRKCQVANREIFNYADAIYDEPLFLFQTDESLAHFLRDRCPELDRSALNPL